MTNPRYFSLRLLSYIRQNPILILSLIIALGLGLRLIHLNAPVWGDETTSWAIARRTPFQEMWQRGLRESTPPLYYSMLHFTLPTLGEKPAALRAISVIFGITVIPLTYFAMRAGSFGNGISLTAAFITACSSALIYYSQEARAYALFIFTTLISFLFLFRSIQKPSLFNQIVYGISCIVLSYSHRYGLFMLPVGWLCAFIYRQWRLFVISICASVLIAIDLNLQLQRQTLSIGIAGREITRQAIVDLITTLHAGTLGMQNVDNMPNPGMLAFPNPFINQIIPPLTILIFFAVLIIGGIRIRKLSGSQKLFSTILWISISIPITLAIIAGSSFSPKPQWLLRGIVNLIPLYFMALIIALKDSPLRSLFIGMIIVMNLFGLSPYFSTYTRFGDQAAFDYLNREVSSQDIVISDPWYMINFIDYYYDGSARIIAYDNTLGWIDAEAMLDENKMGIITLTNLPSTNGNIYVFFKNQDLGWVDSFPNNPIFIWDSPIQAWKEYKFDS